MRTSYLLPVSLLIVGTTCLSLLIGCDKEGQKKAALSESFQTRFMKSCLKASEDNHAGCTCALEKIAKNLSVDDIKEYEALSKAGKEVGTSLHGKIQALIKDCAK